MKKTYKHQDINSKGKNFWNAHDVLEKDTIRVTYVKETVDYYQRVSWGHLTLHSRLTTVDVTVAW